MATHREVQKQLLDLHNRGELGGHLLKREIRGSTHLFSWATAAGEVDVTYLAKDARKLWLFQFHLAARVELCRTVVSVSCPERYRLRVEGQLLAQHRIELQIMPGDEFSQRLGYEIVDEQEAFDCQARYDYDGVAAVGSARVPIAGALDLV